MMMVLFFDDEDGDSDDDDGDDEDGDDSCDVSVCLWRHFDFVCLQWHCWLRCFFTYKF